MFSLKPGHAGPKRAEAADDQVDLHPRLAGAVQGADDLAVFQAVHLGDDPRRPAGTLVLDLALDHLQEPALHVHRRHQQLVVVAFQRSAGQVVEQLDDVVRDRRVAGEQPQVGVEPGRAGVVVAGAQVGVAADAVGVLADDQRGLGVRLEPDDAVDDVDAGLFQGVGQLDVALFVEPRLELDEADDLLAGLGGADQRAR